MSKHRHSKDKMHITYTQLKNEWSGKKALKSVPFVKLPYYCCSLSLAPFENPVCTSQGQVFEMLYIIPFIKKYQRNPVTGKPLKSSELIKMHWSKNEKNQFQDPVSYKIFTDFTHIVCIRTSGYVYAYDTIEQLNKKPKNYQDLMTNQKFTLQDIILIQDPKKMDNRTIEKFDFVQNNLTFQPEQKLQPTVQSTISITNVMQEIKEKKRQRNIELEKQIQIKKKLKLQQEARIDVKGFIDWCLEAKVYKHERFTDTNSASTTSTSYTPDKTGQTTYRNLKQNQIRAKIHNYIKKEKAKAYVQMVTNKGVINMIIHADLVPYTAENFVELSENGYYDGVKFHRLVKDFCLQGGDPTGTGSGGESIYGHVFQDEFHEKLSHYKAGILSMANSGPDTNTSQFFITLSECKKLDQKHTVFGQILDGQNILYSINKNASIKSEKPRQEILIEKMNCYENPFRKAILVFKEAFRHGVEDLKNFKTQQDKERWIERDDCGFKLPATLQKTQTPKNTLTNLLLADYM